MKNLYFLTALCFVLTQIVYGQESYNVLKVSSENAPVIDGQIDEIWSVAEMVTLTKNVDDGDRTTEKDPPESDYKAEFALFWSDDGLYILTRLNDDIYVNDNEANWWRDDDVNFLIPPDLISTGVMPLEFAWLVNSNVEGKAIPYQNVAADAVSAAWSNTGTTYILEAYIKWSAFTAVGTAGSNVLFEARARDDDKDGESIYPQSFLQWSTELKSVESDGIGLGTLTLLADEATSVGPAKNTDNYMINVFPNPAENILYVEHLTDLPGSINGSITDLTGKEVMSFTEYNTSKNIKTLNVSSLKTGIYFITIRNSSQMIQHKLCIIK